MVITCDKDTCDHTIVLSLPEASKLYTILDQYKKFTDYTNPVNKARLDLVDELQTKLIKA
jgi:hypothetical protein